MFRLMPLVAIAGGILMVLLGGMMLMGCVATQMNERPFTHEWNDLQQVNAELARREAHINSVDAVSLIGSPKEGGVYVGKDQEGKPKLNIGQETGWRMDLDYDNGPKAKVRYKLEWDFAKPD